MEKENEIYFYEKNGKYGFMSNFYNSTFVENNISFNCSEQYFMYYKCLTFDKDNLSLLSKILHETSPPKIKRFGRQVNNYNDDTWNEIRYNVMLKGLILKFSQNNDLKEQLLSTNPKFLYEASPIDKIWGIGFTATDAVNKEKTTFGQNLLGKALMETRNYLMQM